MESTLSIKTNKKSDALGNTNNGILEQWLKRNSLKVDYIIGIQNGVAKVKYLNTKENRIHIASLGYDIVSVSKDEANDLWKSTVLLTTSKLDNDILSSGIKQFN
jgi:hypothetical protein